MRATRVDIRYAKSLLSLAKERDVLDVVYNDMNSIADICEECKDLSLLLKSPIVKSDKKLSILKAVFAGSLGELSSAFVDLIVKKKREGHLHGIAVAFASLYKADKQILTAKVTTAFNLDVDLKDQIMGILSKNNDGSVELEEVVNKELIGGFVLRVGDKELDSSIRTQIDKLHREFSQNPFVKEF